MIFFRISAACYRITALSWLGFIASRVNTILNGIVIGRGVDIQSGFVIMHSNGVVINGRVQAGNNLVVQSGVVVGAGSFEDRSTPVIGNDVHLGSGCKLVGGISIGNNVTVGANAVVIKNVPNNSIAVGIPAKFVIQKLQHGTT